MHALHFKTQLVLGGTIDTSAVCAAKEKKKTRRQTKLTCTHLQWHSRCCANAQINYSVHFDLSPSNKERQREGEREVLQLFRPGGGQVHRTEGIDSWRNHVRLYHQPSFIAKLGWKKQVSARSWKLGRAEEQWWTAWTVSLSNMHITCSGHCRHHNIL